MVYSVVDIFVWLNKTVHDSVSLSDSMSLSACPSLAVDGDSLPENTTAASRSTTAVVGWVVILLVPFLAPTS